MLRARIDSLPNISIWLPRDPVSRIPAHTRCKLRHVGDPYHFQERLQVGLANLNKGPDLLNALRMAASFDAP